LTSLRLQVTLRFEHIQIGGNLSSRLRLATGTLVGGGLLLSAYLLVKSGLYGLSLFAILPVILGGLGAWMTNARTSQASAGYGALAGLAGTGCFFLLGWEGAICILMSLPLVLPLSAAGGFLVWTLSLSRQSLKRAGLILLLPPASLAWDWNARAPVFEVRTSIEIAAPPETVWRNVVSFSDLPDPQEWYFRAGLAYPKRARIDGRGPGAVRYCEFSTGPFVEPIDVWEEPTLLRFQVTENPPPMEEWSPYRKVVPQHVHGYLVSRQGQFRLTALPNNRTLLEGTTWYQHGLLPAEYWRWWSDAIIHRIHFARAESHTTP
jgi:Polyketide cyclase / dehydrase and lipid transport